LLVDGTHYRTIWVAEDGWSVEIIDQTRLPHRLETVTLSTLEQAAEAIRSMLVRGAPLIGATAAYGICLALRANPTDAGLEHAVATLQATRPTAVNLAWALEDMRVRLQVLPADQRVDAAYARAAAICDEDAEMNRGIGDHGLALIRDAAKAKPDGRVNVLTHCNAGWLATVDWGTATAPIYRAQQEGIPIHIWVDETRPRNQGASLTAWELDRAGVPHTVVVDNAGGHLMQHGLVDLCLVGTDRTTRKGDVCNKIGTYLKALAAHDNDVPFHVALPSPTIDWAVEDAIAEIPIEERSGREVSHITGMTDDGRIETVAVTPPGSALGNPAFDVTPARLVTSLITERGIAAATEDGLLALFPEHRPNS